MKTAFFHAVAVAALASASPCLADTHNSPLDSVVVTAHRSPQRIETVGGQITLLDSEAIRTSQALIVSDLLARTPGVTVSRNGGAGQATQLRIRGAETDQTVVVIDGVKLNDPSAVGGGYNFGNLLIGDVAQIEILRGAQSVLWGSQAIGGVVNIITADPSRPWEADVTVEAGTRHTAYLRAGVGGKSERLVWRAAAHRYVTDGVSSFSQDRGGIEKDGFRNTGVSGKARLTLTDQLSVDWRAVYSNGRNEFDGFPAPLFAFADTNEYGETTDIVGYAGLNLDLLEGRFKNRLAYGYTLTDRETFDPRQAVTPRTFGAEGRNRRWEYQGGVELAKGWSAVFGAEDEHSSLRTVSPSAFAPTPPPATRARTRLTGAYVQVLGEVVPGLTLVAGVRRDDHQTFGDSSIGQASAAWTLNGGATVLRASWGQGFKAPTLFQLYSDFGNARLQAEEAQSWDAGVRQSFVRGRIVLEGAYFERETENQIDFFSCAAASTLAGCIGPSGARRFGFYDNTAQTQARGIELQGRADATDRLSLSANYTWTDTENSSPGPGRGKALQRRPEHAATAEASYLWPVGLNTVLAVGYVGDSFDDASNRNRIKRYALVDLRAAYPVNERLEVYGRIENLGDRRYETVASYGQPRRTAAVGMRARF